MSKQFGNDDEFDACMRDTLRTLPKPEGDYVQMPRRSFLQLGFMATGLAALGTSGWFTLQYLSVPEFVRQAFAHADDEKGLRGVLVPDMHTVQAMLGNSLPGVLQLCKDCVVGGFRAWHLMSYLDNLGYVTVFAFRGYAPELTGRGHWLRGYWQFVRAGRDDLMLVISAHQEALNVVVRQLQA